MLSIVRFIIYSIIISQWLYSQHMFLLNINMHHCFSFSWAAHNATCFFCHLAFFVISFGLFSLQLSIKFAQHSASW